MIYNTENKKVNINYSLYTENAIKAVCGGQARKRLLLHVCCAPCSSYVLEYLNGFFDITVFFYNPNIDDADEYRRRAAEEQRLLCEMKFANKPEFVEGRYDPMEFYETVKGLEKIPEGGARCVKCFELRLRETAKYAVENGFDCFTTTLSISPLKNSRVLNALGESLSGEYGLEYLFSDFKKKNGYKRSVELSRIYGLYRQNYCGCSFSKAEAESRAHASETDESALR